MAARDCWIYGECLKIRMMVPGEADPVSNLDLVKQIRRTNNSPDKGRDLCHVTPKFSGKRSKISSKLLELGTSNLVYSFVFGKPSGRVENFLRRGVS